METRRRGPTTRQRVSWKLPARPGWQPELGLRPQLHAADSLWEQWPPSAERIADGSQDLDAPVRLAAKRKIDNYRQQYADNQKISFLPAIVCTSIRKWRQCMANFRHGNFLHLFLFLQARLETEAHFSATGMPSERNNSDMFRFRRAAFYQSLKRVGEKNEPIGRR
jgi:hypothetical protein